MLADGTYDAVVVDASDEADVVVLELAILTGLHKGDVVTVRTARADADPLDLLAVPATLTVTDGEPSVQLEG